MTLTLCRGENVYAYLNSHLGSMAKDQSSVDLLASSLHVWPDFHGNRSPLADPTLRGAVRGERAGCSDLTKTYQVHLSWCTFGMMGGCLALLYRWWGCRCPKPWVT